MLCALILFTGFGAKAQKTEKFFNILEVRKIWDQAEHNAFTDLIRFQGKWYCAFREGKSHASDDGKLRVIRSADEDNWESVVLLEWEGGDLRDAKLSVAAGGQLMLGGAVRFIHPVNGNNHQSLTWLSKDGLKWSDPFACPSGLGTWRWSNTWYDGMGYSIGYSGKNKGGCLYGTRDGITWEVIRDSIFPDVDSYPNETSLVFDQNGRVFCMLRRDKGSSTALLGISDPPYANWSWKDLGVRIGGPKMIRLSDGCFLSAVRLYDGRTRTSLCLVDPCKGSLEECLQLPSGGDTSYAGMIENDGMVWISYYSSHEEKTSIYLARVRIGPL